MQKTLEAVGFLVMVAGISGIVNHFWDGWRIFNLVNAVLIGRLIPSLSPFEIFVDITVAVLGLVVMLAPAGLEPQRA